MQNQHPLFRDLKSDVKFITIGEIMLRLSPPNYQKIRMANEFEATYGGSEANIALSLANLGIDSTFENCGYKMGRWLGVIWLQKWLNPLGEPTSFPKKWTEVV